MPAFAEEHTPRLLRRQGFSGEVMIRNMFSTAALLALSATTLPALAETDVVVPLPPIEQIDLHFAPMDVGGALIKEKAVLAQVAKQAQKATRWQPTEHRGLGNSFMRVGDGSQLVLGGTRVTAAARGCAIDIEYKNVIRFSTGDEYGTTMPIHVTCNVEHTNSDVVFHLRFPTEAHMVTHRFLLVSPGELPPVEEMQADYQRVASAFSDVTVTQTTEVNGEIESKYRPEAVLANFERLLGRQGLPTAVSASGARDESFTYSANGIHTLVHVSVFPYHDGSKVVYRAVLPYTLKSDGTRGGDQGLSVFQDDLNRVVND